MEDIRPDSSFVRQMGMLDKRLGIKFNGTRFVITFTTERHGEVNIWTVVGEKGEFRQPDQRELDMLRDSDIERIGPEERFNLALAYMQHYGVERKRVVKEEIRDRTKDDKIQLAQGFAKVAGYSKANSTFRRIERVGAGGDQ